MHDLIASPFLNDYLLVRPSHAAGIKIPTTRYLEVSQAADNGDDVPAWLVEAAHRRWGLDLAHRPAVEAILVRSPSAYGYARASYEINKGCDYDCPHCYLGQKKFEGLSWEHKAQLLEIMRDAGVLWLQITGGEPLIDRHFPAVYAHAHDLGMMVAISSNGSQLAKPLILDCLTERRPYRITLSVYGATAETYDGFTRNRGAFDRFTRGLAAAREAALPVRLNLIVSSTNAHEVDDMRALADRYGFPHQTYTNMSPTIDGSGEPLPTQAEDFLRQRKPFTGCNAGHTFFHADPFGVASICKVGREPNIRLIEEGVEGLRRLGDIADSLMLRTGGCSGCQLSGTCWTCRPLAKLYQEAKAPLNTYCQHGGR
ncbi:radical SAM protein [Streptomyces sp. NBC_00286]|uniref:radical SAM protein n=1 Tax=Streptomyces sp. NBC_00286 TaxID=2975701 RepID=UPI002E2AE99F|nr:radical SAM protein [Streptomyces sp. NBC_00286]